MNEHKRSDPVSIASRPGEAVAPPPEANLSLLETLDRLLNTGVVAQGDLTISVAGVDLVYLNLKALLTSVANLEAGPSTPERITTANEKDSL